MQVFRLVKPGYVDRVIAFESLPNDLIEGITTNGCNGLHDGWKDLISEFYCLDYLMVNKDKQKW